MADETLLTETARAYSYSIPLDPNTSSGDVSSNVLNSCAFRRLMNIRFLGGIDYVLVRSPNGSERGTRYTRYQHSLGVGRLSLQYAKRVALSEADTITLFLAALLHDVGHSPFSHSLEPVFEAEFGLSHHDATKNIICGRVDIGKELYSTLRSGGIDVERVLALVDGEEGVFDNFFGGPINFDTIRGNMGVF